MANIDFCDEWELRGQGQVRPMILSLCPTRDLRCCLATSLSLWDKFIPINIVPYKGAP